ncbi:MAG: YidC/Oxa1 family membrane protein insertase [Clostridia bacterium]|nr:YidC/Oxa1 family membrane protein insertase [Clostridia bacterium]
MDFIYNAFGAMLKFFTSISGGYYAVALIFYALVFKIVFLPFAIKQQKNQIKMAKLTPKIELIKAKYRGRTDQVTMRKQQEEIMQLQQQEGYNPLSGCLPMLLQLPIIIWLYKVIRMPLTYIMGMSDVDVINFWNKFNPDNLYQNQTFNQIDQIHLVSQMKDAGMTAVGGEALPNFTLFGFDLGIEPSDMFWPLILIPVFAAAFQWFQMWITKKVNGNANAVVGQDPQTGASMKIMDIIMPLITLFIAYGFSAMMGLYWIFQSILGIAQTLILAKVMPMPRYTEEQLKAMRKEQKAVEKAQKSLLKQNPKYRSLHYIDADDYDDLPTLKTKDTKKSNTKSVNSMDIPEIKD